MTMGGAKLGFPDVVAPRSSLSLPLDLWPIIAIYASPYNASKISLTCRGICELVQPFVFRRVVFHPFCTSEAEIDDDLGQTLKKLAFLKAPRFAHRVQEISICPRRRRRDHILNQTTLVSIMNSLPSFSGLQRLFLKNIKLPHNEEENTWPPLAPLQVLSLEGCTGLRDLICDAGVNVQTLICDRNIQKSPNYLESFLPLVHVQSLQSLVIETCASLNLPTLLIIMESPFRQLVELDACESIIFNTDMIAAFSLLQNLTSLRLRHPPRDFPVPFDMSPLPQSCLPSLTSYEGPYTLAPALSPGRALRKYVLWPAIGNSLYYSHSHLCQALSALNPGTSILELGSIVHIDEAFLLVILQTFPQLKRLSVNAHPSFAPPTIDMPSLVSDIGRTKLPTTLEHLSLGVHWDPLDTQGIIVDLISTFTNTCLEAQTVELWYNPYKEKNCFVWKRRFSVNVPITPIPDELFSIFQDDLCDFQKKPGEFPEF